MIFERLLKRWDEAKEDTRDHQYMVQQMVTEMNLCERTGKSVGYYLDWWRLRNREEEEKLV